MEQWPRISLVTINLNQADYLEETIRSVIDQGYPNLEYIIVDGGSTDGSLEVIKRFENQITSWISEPDDGHVYALAKGLQQTTGELMGWINSDDMLFPGSLFSVARIFRQEQLEWITGRPAWFSEKGFPMAEMPMTAFASKHWQEQTKLQLKYARWSRNRFLTGDYMAIQQESTFWTRRLWDLAGSKIDTNYKVAFEMELWCRFFRHAELVTVDTLLGGFRVHGQYQQSVSRNPLYREECEKAIQAERSKLSSIKKIKVAFLGLTAKLTKPFFYYETPVLSKLYRWFFRLPALLSYNQSKGAFVYLKD